MRTASRKARWWRSVIVATTALSITACLKSTEPQPSLLQLAGTWSYTGVQSNPIRENLSGTLTISRESGTSFQGILEAVSTNPQSGVGRPISGPVSGSEENGSVIDFDADVESITRRHVGEIVADTITGTWVGSSSDGTVISGTFRAEKGTR